jgi:hypothetical protein
LLSLVRVLEWRAAVTPDSVALSDHLGADLSYADHATGQALRPALRELFWTGMDRRVS